MQQPSVMIAKISRMSEAYFLAKKIAQTDQGIQRADFEIPVRPREE